MFDLLLPNGHFQHALPMHFPRIYLLIETGLISWLGE